MGAYKDALSNLGKGRNICRWMNQLGELQRWFYVIRTALWEAFEAIFFVIWGTGFFWEMQSVRITEMNLFASRSVRT